MSWKLSDLFYQPHSICEEGNSRQQPGPVFCCLLAKSLKQTWKAEFWVRFVSVTALKGKVPRLVRKSGSTWHCKGTALERKVPRLGERLGYTGSWGKVGDGLPARCSILLLSKSDLTAKLWSSPLPLKGASLQRYPFLLSSAQDITSSASLC